MFISKKNNLIFLLIVAGIIFLSACERGISNADTKQLILPTIIEYTADKQRQLASELESGSCPVSAEFIRDYGIMRDQTRAALR